jgi:hypothetical protein
VNPRNFIPPLAALVVASGWLAWQRHAIAVVAGSNENLLQRLDRASLSGEAAASPTDRRASALTGKPDWKKLALNLEIAYRQGSDFRPYTSLCKIILPMSADEQVAAIQEIEASDASKEGKMELLSQILISLSQSDPQAAAELSNCLDADEHGRQPTVMREILGAWVSKDRTAAAAWLDRQLETGRFGKQSRSGAHYQRCELEGVLLAGTTEADLPAATTRIAALSQEERDKVFSNTSLSYFNPGIEKTQVALAKTFYGEKGACDAATSTASSIARLAGYDEVTTYLSTIDASPAQREAAASAALSEKINIYTKSYDETLEKLTDGIPWLRATVPDAAARITGQMLGQLSNNQDFTPLADLAVRYSGENGSDETLATFLASPGSQQNAATALAYVDRIQDPEQREKLRAQFQAIVDRQHPH